MHHNHLRLHQHERRQFNFGGIFGEASTATSATTEEPETTAQAVATTVKAQSVVQSTVYVTASPTFSGAIGGFTTILPSTSSTKQQTTLQQQTTTQQTTQQQQTTPTTQQVETSSSSTETSATPTTTQTPTTTALSSTASAILNTDTTSASSTVPTVITTASSAAAASTLVSSYVAAISSGHKTSAAATSSASQAVATSDASTDVSQGLSSGAKVGIVLSVLLALAMIAGATIWFVLKRKRERELADAGNEKDAFVNTGGPMPGSKAAMKAPRVSLRPMTQFFGNNNNNNNNSFGAHGAENNKPLPMAAIPAQRNLTNPNVGQSPWERRAAERNANNPFKDPSNPFSDSNKAPSPSPPQTPTISITPPQGSPSEGAKGEVAAVAAGAIAGAAAGTKGPAPLDVNKANGQAKAGLTSPESTKSLDAAGAGGPGNVHRVQLEFKPSMDDEIELISGQLVRVLHEYDDGWALCMRLDRSQQGVAPRTCLSARPVKPRPAQGSPRPGPGPGPNGPPRGPPGPNGAPRGPPGPGPQGRPMSPAGQQPRPMSPAMRNGPRPASPAGQQRPMSPAMRNGPRPASPAGQQPRPMSPGMQNGPRSSSPAGMRPNANLPRKPSPMGPGVYNQPPRPYSPGPKPGPRSQSPGPYGAPGASKPPTPVNQRRRSNSASGVLNAAQNDVQAPAKEDLVGWRPSKPQTPPPTIALPPAPVNNNGVVGQAISSDDSKSSKAALELQSY